MKKGTVNVLFSLLFTQCSSGASIWEEGERASLSAYLTLYPSLSFSSKCERIIQG